RERQEHSRNLYSTLLALTLGELSAATPTERAVGYAPLCVPSHTNCGVVCRSELRSSVVIADREGVYGRQSAARG
ncbi:MAG: hypothetical protein FWH14_08135, partial [Oscillospiraceae bacterium]|nr:hypothetical protein [Oscillospiraceae bacterium]